MIIDGSETSLRKFLSDLPPVFHQLAQSAFTTTW